MSNTRRAFIDIFYKGVNITEEVSRDLISASYTDNENGKADKITLTFKDQDSKWLNNWRPRKGDTVELTIFTLNWRFLGDSQSLDCGVFKVDRVKHGGPPTIVTVEAASVNCTSSFRSRVKNRTWSDIRLKELAEQIAEANNLSLFFDSTDNPLITKSEQAGQSDANYLAKQAARYGFGIKIHKESLILFRVEDLDSRVGVLKIDKSDCSSWELESSASSFLEEVIVAYYDPVRNITRKAGFIGPLQPDVGNSQILLPQQGPNRPQQVTLPNTQDPINLQGPDAQGPKQPAPSLIPTIVGFLDLAQSQQQQPTPDFGEVQGPPKQAKINTPFFSVGEGEKIAKSEFIRRNKSETMIKLNGLPLNLEAVVGVNIYLTGFGSYNGKYSIEVAKHSVGGGSKTDIELKRTVVV